ATVTRGSHCPICSSVTGSWVRASGDASPAISRPRQSSSIKVPLGNFCSSLGSGNHHSHVANVIPQPSDTRTARVIPPLPFCQGERTEVRGFSAFVQSLCATLALPSP